MLCSLISVVLYQVMGMSPMELLGLTLMAVTLKIIH